MAESDLHSTSNGTHQPANTTSNGNQQSINTTSKLDKKPKQQRFLPPLPNFSSAAEMHSTSYSVLVDKTPSDFLSLPNYTIFSMTADGSFPMLKISVTRAVTLSDAKTYPTGGGRVYRISMAAH